MLFMLKLLCAPYTQHTVAVELHACLMRHHCQFLTHVLLLMVQIKFLNQQEILIIYHQ